MAVALGATAARALVRKTLTINANRGRLIALPDGRQGVITVHPSYLLRLQEERDKRREFDLLVKDLHFAAEAASSHSLALNLGVGDLGDDEGRAPSDDQEQQRRQRRN